MPLQRDIPRHGDTGLQPERTDLAWRRTTFSLAAAATVFLRWMDNHGWFAVSLVVASVLTAVAISVTRKVRFHRAILGINQEQMRPNIHSLIAVATSVLGLAVLGIYAVIVLPLTY